MFTQNSPLVLSPAEGETVQLAGLGVRFMGGGEGFSIVEHPLGPRTLGAPMHTHTNEDEFSYVLEGRLGVQIGDDVLVAGPGDLVTKPRGVPHAFWNAGDEPARALEIISPGGFVAYFAEAAELLGVEGEPDFPALAALQARYGLEMDLGSIERLVAAHGLTG